VSARPEPRSGRDVTLALALAAFFSAIQFYPALAALSPTPAVGYLFLDRSGAAAVVALLVLTAAFGFLRLRAAPADAAGSAPSRRMLALWLGAAVVSSLLGVDPVTSLEAIALGGVAAVFHLTLVRFYARPPVAALVLSCYLTVGGLATLAAIGMDLVRRPAALYALNHGRAAGPFVTTNQFGAFLVFDAFLALGIALATRRRWLARLAVSNGALALAGLALSFSRGAWLGAAAGACLYAALLGARRTAFAGAALVVLTAAVVLGTTVAGHNPAEAFTRLTTLTAGLRVATLFPLTGSGPMTYYELFPQVRPSNGGLPGSFEALHPHNVVLSLLGELGIAGTLAVTLGWIVFGRAVRARLAGAPPANRRLACAICAAFAALFVQGMADLIGIVEMTFVWIPYAALGLAAASHGLAE